jgi:predicted RND superfamily exporter protein
MDVLNYLPDNDPDVRFFKETGGKFGSNYINFVAIEADDIFTADRIRTLLDLTVALEKVSGVKQVLSLGNYLDMRRDQGTLSVSALIDKKSPPTNPEQLKALRDYSLENPVLVGNFISADGRAALISVRIEENANKEEVARQIRALSKEHAPNSTLYFGGFSMIMEFMGRMISGDMARLIPITLLVVLLALYLGFGSLRGVLLPISTVFLSIIWTLGAMSFFGISLSMLTSAIPVVIIAIGTASGSYVMVEFYRQSDSNNSADKDPKRFLARVGMPVVVSGVAMALGFLSLATAPNSLFKEFGYAACLGAFISTLLSTTFVPAVLASLPDKSPRSFALASPQNKIVQKGLDSFSGFVVRNPILILVLGAVALIISFASYARIPHHQNLLSYFPKGSEPQVSEKLLQRHFGGSQLFIVNFRAKDIRHPAILEVMGRLGKQLRNLPNVNFPQSPADLVSMLNRLINDEPGLPDSPEKVTNLWLLLEGQPAVSLLVEQNFTNAVVQARIGDIDPTVVVPAIASVSQILEKDLPLSWVTVPYAPLPPKYRQPAARYHAGRIADNVVNDYAFHQKSAPPPVEPIATAIETALVRPAVVQKQDRANLKAEFFVYLSGDESEILFDGANDPYPVAQSLSLAKQFDVPTLTQILNDVLPLTILNKDPEAVGYAASSVAIIVDQYIHQKNHLNIVEEVVGILGVPKGAKQLRADIEGDLWAVNHEFFSIDSKTYQEIFKKAPDENQVTRFEARLTGFPPISAKFDAQLVASQVKSVLMAVVTILIVLTFFYRSFVHGIIATIPIAFTVLCLFGIMGVFRVALDDSTIMIAGIGIGIGVGYAIHYLSEFQRRLASGDSWEQAAANALNTKGRAILINTLAVGLGFSVLIFSVMTPQKRLGVLIAAAVCLAALGTATVLPAVIVTFKPKVLGRQARKRS